MCLLVRTSEGPKAVIAGALMTTRVPEIIFLSAIYVWAMSQPAWPLCSHVCGCKASFGRNKGVLIQGERRCKDRAWWLVTLSIAFSTDVSSPYDVPQFLG